MASINTGQSQDQTIPVGEAARTSPPPPDVIQINQLLLIAASRGDCEALKSVLNWGDAPVRPPPQVAIEVPGDDTIGIDITSGSLEMQASRDDESTDQPDISPNNGSNTNGGPTNVLMNQIEEPTSDQMSGQPCTGSPTDVVTNQQQDPTSNPGCPGDDHGSSTNGGSAVQHQPPTDAAEQRVEQPAAPSVAESLLEGVTPDGDTALHVIVSGCSGENILDCIYVIYTKAKRLLYQANKRGDTPLHCAARIGNHKVSSYFIYLAKEDSSEKTKELLRKKNMHGETALHEAIRAGSEDIVMLLLREDSELARRSSNNCTSPLYMAILLRRMNIVEQLYDKDKFLSYSGPGGQNALHAAVIAGEVFTKKLVAWNRNLATGKDANGSTPLHFAAGLLGRYRRASVCRLVLEANMAAVCQPDNDGLFPIHAAASVDAYGAISLFVEKCPSSAGLRDAKGRTFLHIAVEKNQWVLVYQACWNRKLAWIMNMQDNDGNTALHLAVKAGNLMAFSALFGNRQVYLNPTNTEGKTPLDIANYNVSPGMVYSQNSEIRIRRALTIAGGKIGVSRKDHFKKDYKYKHEVKSDYATKENEKLKDTTQILSIGTVLIATVTFGATFALPGGYRADDHPNGGTPTLAGRYAFDAFMMANTIAFICSSIATVGFMYSGSPMVQMGSRKVNLFASVYFMQTSIAALAVAFALGAYMVLAPVARKTAIGISVLSALVVLSHNVEFWWKLALLAPGYCIRNGRLWTIRFLTNTIVGNMLLNNWPIVFIFCWPANSRNHQNMEAPAQPPVPVF